MRTPSPSSVALTENAGESATIMRRGNKDEEPLRKGLQPAVGTALAASYIAARLIIGPSAFSVFFVLTGMVLYGTFDGKDGFHYLPFLIKRVTRLYPPVATAVLVSLALYFAIQPHPVAGL